jgi:hypothetical protein
VKNILPTVPLLFLSGLVQAADSTQMSFTVSGLVKSAACTVSLDDGVDGSQGIGYVAINELLETAPGSYLDKTGLKNAAGEPLSVDVSHTFKVACDQPTHIEFALEDKHGVTEGDVTGYFDIKGKVTGTDTTRSIGKYKAKITEYMTQSDTDPDKSSDKLPDALTSALIVALGEDFMSVDADKTTKLTSDKQLMNGVYYHTAGAFTNTTPDYYQSLIIHNHYFTVAPELEFEGLKDDATVTSATEFSIDAGYTVVTRF